MSISRKSDVRNADATHHIGAEQTITLIEQTLGKEGLMRRRVTTDCVNQDPVKAWTCGYREGKTSVCVALGHILEIVSQLNPYQREEFIELLKAVVDGCPIRDDEGDIIDKHWDLAESQ
jgi:hypothetical protein